MQTWTFLTTYARSMLFIARHPDAGYVIKHREGRRNRYEVQRRVPLHDVPAGRRTMADLLRALDDVEPSQDAGTS